MQQSESVGRLAVLIDADNAPRTAMKAIMAEIAVYGTPTVKRIYGDWTTPNMSTWKPILLENAITPIQQYSYTTGKNSTDSAMIIDAMDLLYNNDCEGFVLVSSDSDFTRLATRLREAGKNVIGMGERKTPEPFIVACNRFIYIESIRAAFAAGQSGDDDEPPSKPSAKSSRRKDAEPTVTAQGVPQAVVDLIADSLAGIADEDGYAFMGELGNLLLRKQPDFDPRNYGFQKLTQLVKSLDRFEIDARPTSNPHTKHVYLRDKEAKD